MNTQATEPRDIHPEGRLQVHSVFYTIQGEGPFTGHPAVFVRLAGCNLQCPACDTDYTSERKEYDAEALFLKVIAIHKDVKLVVVTGGEPFRQNITPFVSILLREGIRVQVETNGTLPPPPDFEFLWRGFAARELEHSHLAIVVSPKTNKVAPQVQGMVTAYKYVLEHGKVMKNGLPETALGHKAFPHLFHPAPPERGQRRVPIYLQPQDDKNSARNLLNQDAVVRQCLHFGYILQLQLHKLIGVE